MIRLLEEGYEAIYPEMDLKMSAPSSAAVPTGLIDGNILVGAMSRPMSQTEKQAFFEKYGYPIKEFRIARDALIVVIHGTNPLPGITMEQLDGVYSDRRLRGGPKIQTWGDLGLSGAWASQPVKAFGGGEGWGTTTTFEKLVCYGALSREDISVEDIENGIPDAVSKDAYSIGYTCLGTTQKDIKAVPIAETASDPFVAPTPENLLDGSYPLERDLYLYVAPDQGGRIPITIREFLRFILSKEGQAAVADSGMIPLTAPQVKKEQAKLSPNEATD
jgi:phosphate transport system substrate-binding protein